MNVVVCITRNCSLPSDRRPQRAPDRGRRAQKKARAKMSTRARREVCPPLAIVEGAGCGAMRAPIFRAAPITSKLSPFASPQKVEGQSAAAEACVMTILVDLLIFAGGFISGAIVMACFAAGAVISTTRSWSSPLGTSADRENNAPPEQDRARRENPTGLRLAARSGGGQPSPDT
jgi:hypothetical protein